ncbi:hypothetical protein IC575_025635 [Cucumis melo]
MNEIEELETNELIFPVDEASKLKEVALFQSLGNIENEL